MFNCTGIILPDDKKTNKTAINCNKKHKKIFAVIIFCTLGVEAFFLRERCLYVYFS